WNTWIAWTQCTVSCNGGTQFRIRLCEERAISECQHRLEIIDSRWCNTLPCSDLEGIWGQWTTWSDCSVHCGKGTQSRFRSCFMTSNRAKECLGHGQENVFCEKKSCQSMSMR
ncbi:hypothetical protein CAPTEDRAFT_100998, partial [Capitella teleta]